MMNTRKYLLFAALPLLAAQSWAQAGGGSGANPISGETKEFYRRIKDTIMKSAEEMPEGDYGYQPTSTVRTFGQLVGHVADGQYEFCSAVVGGPAMKEGEVEKGKTGKTELLAALKASFLYCDKAYDALTDAQASQMVDFFGHKMTKVSVLTYNLLHTEEHYGNLVTYLRMKGLVPPTSKK